MVLLLLLLLLLMMMMNADADLQWSCFLYFIAKDGRELLLRIFDGNRLLTTLEKGKGYIQVPPVGVGCLGVTVSHLFPSFPIAPPSHRMS